MTRYAKLTLGLIVGWFAIALTASVLGLFENAANRLGIPVAIAATVPILIFMAWYRISSAFRNFVLGLNPQWITAVHSLRLMGFTFVLLEARDQLPAVFALPAGYGDMFIGATAILVAWMLANPARRGAFIFWQILGIVDLVNAVGLGVTSRLLTSDGASMHPMTVLPLSLVPTFFVPLYLILHLICIAQARRWPTTVGAMHATGPARA